MSIQDTIFDLETELENLQAGENTMENFQELIEYIGHLETEKEKYTNFYHTMHEVVRSVDKIREG